MSRRWAWSSWGLLVLLVVGSGCGWSAGCRSGHRTRSSSSSVCSGTGEQARELPRPTREQLTTEAGEAKGLMVDHRPDSGRADAHGSPGPHSGCVRPLRPHRDGGAGPDRQPDLRRRVPVDRQGDHQPLVLAKLFRRAGVHRPRGGAASSRGGATGTALDRGALVLYLAVFSITISVNVPLNDGIKAGGDPDRIADLAAVRERFDEARWIRWNIARVVTHIHSRARVPHVGPCAPRAHRHQGGA